MTTKKTPAKAKAPALDPQPLSPSAPAPATDESWVLNSAFHDIAMANGKLQEGLPIDQSLTGTERMRLIGVRARNYGFITKTWEVANARPDFLPPKFSMANMSTLVDNLNRARDLSTLIQQLQRLVDDYMMTVGTQAYRDALQIYGQLRAMARAKVPGANEIFQQLRQFFTLRRRRPGEPTLHELERDFHSLLHKHADGEMIIKNESPHTTGGVHEVVDEVHKHGRHGAEIKVEEEE